MLEENQKTIETSCQTNYFNNFEISKHGGKIFVNVIIAHCKFTTFIVIYKEINSLNFIEFALKYVC